MDITLGHPSLVAIISFAKQSFRNEVGRPQSSEDSKEESDIKLEKFDGLSIWASSYKATNQSTAEAIAIRILSPQQPTKEKENELFLIEKMSQEGIAPRLIKMDKQNGLVSTVYIKSPEERPWHPLNMTAKKIKKFARLLKFLHSKPIMAEQVTRFDELNEKVTKLAELHPQFKIFKTGIDKMQEINSIQSKHITLKFCHNDIGHGGNVLWDGTKAWLIDWELAGMFNPYFDVASPIALLFFSEEFKNLFFSTYLGSEPTQKEKDLLYLNIQYAYLRYGVTSLGICLHPGEEFTLSASEIDEMGVWTDILKGKISLKREEMQTDFGRCKIGILLIKEALKNMASKEYELLISRLIS